MNRRIINRILNKRVIVMYAIAFLLLLAVTPEPKSVMDILGGFSSQERKGLNIIGIMRWNLCVMSPIMVSILFMDMEMGTLRVYTMIRAKNMKRWFQSRLISIAVSNLIYLFLFVRGVEICIGCCNYRRKDFGLFLLLFFLHSFLMSMISVALCAQNKGIHLAVIFYLTVEGVMVIVGDIFPPMARYLLPYWGMIRQVRNVSDHSYLFFVIGFSVLLIVVCCVFIIKSLRV